MGKLWGNEYAIGTATSTGSVFSDAERDNPWKLIPLKATMNDVKISRVVKREIMVGLAARTERLFNNASDPTRFAQGLLNHTIVTSAVGVKETKAYLETLYGQNVFMEYHHMAPLNLAHAAHQYLVENQGYSPLTNISTVQAAFQGFPVYLEHMEVRIQHAEGAIMPPAAEQPEWEVPPIMLYLPWDNPIYTDPQNPLFVWWDSPPDSWVYTTTLPSALTFHYAWMGDTPKPGSPTALDWDANGVPETAVQPDLTIPTIQSVGFSFDAAFGETGVDKEDFIRRYTVQVPISSLSYTQGNDYFQSKYFREVAGKLVPGYFTHDPEAGSIASIEATVDLSASEPEFFPIIFLRKDFTTVADPANSGTLEYTQSSFLCQQLGLDYQQFADSMLDHAEVADISQAFFMFGIPIDSQTKVGLRYLFEFFYWLNLDNADRASMNVYSDGDWYRDDLQDKKAIHFTDSSAHIRLEYIGTVSSLVLGNFVDSDPLRIGECASEILTQIQKYRVTRRISYNSNEAQYETVTLERDIKVHKFKKQVTATRYREVLVAEPLLSYRLVDGNGGNEQWAFITDDQDFVIPLSHRLVTDYYWGFEKTQLYAEAMQVQVNSYSIEKLSWYQTSNFGTALTFASFVLVAVTAGGASGAVSGVYATLLSATGSAVVAVILTTLVVIGVEYGLAKLFSLVVNEIGGKWGNIGAILMLVVASYMTTKGMPEAQYWVMSANGLVDASATHLQEELIEFEKEIIDLQKEYETFMDKKEEYEYEIEVRDRLLAAIGLTSVHNPFESADEFYTRVQSGTQGAHLSVNGPEAFLRASLMLPTSTQTLGEQS